MRELLVGVLVDVSGSMTSAIENRSGATSTRLEAFRDALEQLASRAANVASAAERTGSGAELRLFAYGFGFGNALAELLGRRGPAVRDLLAIPGAGDSTVTARQLSDDWPRYKANVERLLPEMFGSTPMGEAMGIARQRFSAHQVTADGQKVLLVVSDGDPTDSSPEAIAAQAAAMKEEGVIVVSCYVTSSDIAEPRKLYASAPTAWPSGARLMHTCASQIPPDSPFESYLREFGWSVDGGGQLFTQVNQSALLAEFMSVVLSPIEGRESRNSPQAIVQSQPKTGERGRNSSPASDQLTPGENHTPQLVLFVHGLGGNAQDTWGRFPDLLASDPVLRSRVAIGYYQFPTSLIRLPFSTRAPRIQDLAAGLKTQIETRYARYSNVVLVCHSLGGLIARRYLIDEQKAGRPSPVSGVILFAVPNNGAGLASVAQYVSWRNAQLRQLCIGSDVIDSMNEDWFTLKLYERLRVRYVVGGVDRVVDVQSARSYWGNPHVDTVIDRGHIDVVKPTSPEDLSYLVVQKFLVEHTTSQ